MAAVMEMEPAVLSRRALTEQLEEAHEDAVTYWSQYGTAGFFRPMGSHWSPAEHVRHLTRSMSPLLPAFRMPKLALRVAFGPGRARSRSLDEVRIAYSAVLAAGGTAGRYAPPPDDRAQDQAWRDRIMDTHSETLRGLTQAMERWSEGDLDAYRLPHPLLGKLTVREMMLFTLLHNRHHVAVAERRRIEAGLTFG